MFNEHEIPCHCLTDAEKRRESRTSVGASVKQRRRRGALLEERRQAGFEKAASLAAFFKQWHEQFPLEQQTN